VLPPRKISNPNYFVKNLIAAFYLDDVVAFCQDGIFHIPFGIYDVAEPTLL